MPTLTKKYIDSIKPLDKDNFYHDDKVKGFFVRVFPSGKKVLGLRYTFNGRSYRYKIGQYGIITPDEARNKALELLGEINNGVNPQDTRAEYRKEATLEEFAQVYIEQHVRTRLKESTQKECIRTMKKWLLPKLGKIKMSDIKRADVAYLHHSMAHVPYQANRTKEILSSIITHAEMLGIRPENSNPCRYVKKYKERKRERFLSSHELAKLGIALNNAEERGVHPSVINLLKLLVLTGCRLSEIWTLEYLTIK
ncbi:MAG: integrase arm-type DNA-binding domain-containing protein [Alphaproteobacteria bacterium]